MTFVLPSLYPFGGLLSFAVIAFYCSFGAPCDRTKTLRNENKHMIRSDLSRQYQQTSLHVPEHVWIELLLHHYSGGVSSNYFCHVDRQVLHEKTLRYLAIYSPVKSFFDNVVTAVLLGNEFPRLPLEGTFPQRTRFYIFSLISLKC